MKNGLKRFVPSDFSFNIWNIPEGTQYFVDQRLKFRKRLANSTVKALHFTDGLFMETYYWLKKREGAFTYWGDINQKIDLITMTDLAKFVMEAISDKNMVGDVMVTGVQMSTKELMEMYNTVTGKKMEAKKLGSIEDLKNKLKEMKKEGKMFEAVQMGFEVMMYDGSVKMNKTMNEMWPNIKPMTWEEFIREMEVEEKSKGKNMYEYSLCDVAKGMNKEMLLKYTY